MLKNLLAATKLRHPAAAGDDDAAMAKWVAQLQPAEVAALKDEVSIEFLAVLRAICCLRHGTEQSDALLRRGRSEPQCLGQERSLDDREGA
jgi:hypothetical protein